MVDDAGVRFVVRMVSGRWEKDRTTAAGAGGAPRNPFLPPDPELLVGHLSATHSVVLNKFPVLDPHLLIVTRTFEHQEATLTRADFEALAFGLAAADDALGFHNGGRVAGASQPHKHLQLVPLPLAAEGPAVPIAPLIADACDGRVPAMPFRHVFRRLEAARNPDDMAVVMHAGYRAMLGELRLGAAERDARLPPYNLLATRSWMLLVPRSRETIEGVSVNGLGFGGALLVRDAGQMEALSRLGPMNVLRRAAFDDR